jgi:spore maturation protein CgeB
MAFNLREAFQDLGHDAQIFDWTQWLYRTKNFTLKNRILDRLFFHKIAKKINDSLINTLKCNDYQLLIVLKGVHVFPSTIIAAKSHVNQVVNWNPDDFFNSLNNSKNLLDSFSKYDCLFTPRSHLKEEYRKKGARRVEVLNWYYLPKFQYRINVPPDQKPEYASDLAFVGTWSKRREEIIDCLQQFRIKVWGTHWHRASYQFRKIIDCRPPIYMENMCKAICSTKINLNILTRENRDTTNVRNFEIPACSGFQLSERTNEILQLFEEDQEIACFETQEELISKCEYYLQHPEERHEIQQRGYRRLVTDDHTIANRARQILTALAL